MRRCLILRQEYFIGADAVGRQIVGEARKVYYTQNTFAVRSHWLRELVHDELASDDGPVHVEPLVRRMVVTVDLRHVYDVDRHASKPEDKEQSEVVDDLEHLLEFENAEWIGIEIRGDGALDGSDLLTQQKIKEICKIVKKLIDLFQDLVTIRKVQRKPGDYYNTFHDLKSYWKKPAVQAEENLRRCRASFEELMQIQIEEWTREVPKVITADQSYWESLLD